jgi:hypothetical protein
MGRRHFTIKSFAGDGEGSKLIYDLFVHPPHGAKPSPSLIRILVLTTILIGAGKASGATIFKPVRIFLDPYSRRYE